jgi:hypothetical protein
MTPQVGCLVAGLWRLSPSLPPALLFSFSLSLSLSLPVSPSPSLPLPLYLPFPLSFSLPLSLCPSLSPLLFSLAPSLALCACVFGFHHGMALLRCHANNAQRTTHNAGGSRSSCGPSHCDCNGRRGCGQGCQGHGHGQGTWVLRPQARVGRAREDGGGAFWDRASMRKGREGGGGQGMCEAGGNRRFRWPSHRQRRGTMRHEHWRER